MWPEPVALNRHDDKRGSFMEICRTEWKQTSYSISDKHVLRGLHYRQPEQTQLVTVLRGTIFDVVANLHTGEHETYELGDSCEFQQILIPPFFAHGYCALEKSHILYQASRHYNAEYERGVRWDSLKIDWPISDLIISKRDRSFPAWIG